MKIIAAKSLFYSGMWMDLSSYFTNFLTYFGENKYKKSVYNAVDHLWVHENLLRVIV
jgi:hypothetical protein